MSKVFISVSSTVDKLIKQVDKFEDEVIARGADKILGSFGSESRKKIGEKQKRSFHFGEMQSKSVNGVSTTRLATFDRKHGWYKATNGLRTIGFSYENVAYKKFRGKKGFQLNPVSEGYVYSLVNNLWGDVAHYTDKRSPYFHGGWYKGSKYGFYPQNYDRPKKETYFTESTVNEAVSPTLQRAEKDLTQLITEAGF